MHEVKVGGCDHVGRNEEHAKQRDSRGTPKPSRFGSNRRRYIAPIGAGLAQTIGALPRRPASDDQLPLAQKGDKTSVVLRQSNRQRSKVES